MNARVRELRKEHLGLTLEKFGEKLGVGKTAINKIELGRCNLTEQMIKSICNVNWDGKMVNEEWLRTGEGSVFSELLPEDEYFKAATQLSDDPEVSAVLVAYWKQDEAGRKAIKDFLRNIVSNLEKQD